MAEMSDETSCWNEIGVWSENATCERLQGVVHCQNCEVYSRAGRGLLESVAPDGYLEEWTTSLARDKESTTANFLSLFVFRIGGEWLSLPMAVIEEVSEARPIRTIPHTSNAVLRGMVNMRGELQLAVSLGALLAIDSVAQVTAEDRLVYERLAVAQHNGARWVFSADEVFGAMRFDASTLGSVPDTVARDRKTYTRGMLEWQYGTVALLDEGQLFQALQRRIYG
jgi:chemotaxis-related protein WspD